LYLEGIKSPIMIIRAKNPAIESKIVPTITCLMAIKVAIICVVIKCACLQSTGIGTNNCAEKSAFLY
ncbi:MAG: hypothetical protein WAT43_09070, partial [Chitinophagales bacterium]